MTSCFLAIRVRPANRHIPRAADGSLPECWLLAEWPPCADEPSDYWLSTLPPDTPAAELVRLAKIRWRIEHDYRELKQGLGLGHFEAAPTPAGTATSPSPPSPRRSAPCSAPTQKPCAGMNLYQVLHELQIVLASSSAPAPPAAQPLTLHRLAAALAGT